MIICYGILPLQMRGEEWQIFVIKRKEGFWEIPKGHQERGETPLKSATRELYEESQLQVKRLLSEDPFQIGYSFVKEGITYEKTVYYFLAEVSGEALCDGKETVDGKWLPLKEAYDLVTYPSTKELIAKVQMLTF